MSPILSSFRLSLFALLAASGTFANGLQGQPEQNLIVNGDFSQGNVGFTSELPYTKPAFNCLWPSGFTIASTFNKPLLHRLIAPDPFPAPTAKSRRDNVFFANAGGTDALVVYATEVKVQPNTRYLISFNAISLSGHIEESYPPHQVATEEWVPEFEIWANNEPSAPYKAGQGLYNKIRMVWNSKRSTEATIKFVRTKFPHGGGIIGISNVQMIPLSSASKADLG